MNDPKAKAVCERFESLKTDRQSYESAWQEIRDLVRPHAADFYKRQSPGDVRSAAIYDSTPVQACDELTAAITSNTTPANERWFTLEAEGDPELNRDPDVAEWFETVADIVFSQYSSSRSRFYPSIYESNADLVAFGTSNLEQEWNAKLRHLVFRAHPLSDTYIDESSDGLVDTVMRELEYSSRQMMQEFDPSLLPEEVKKDEKGDKKWVVVHSVRPRSDRAYGKLDAKNKPYESCWVLKDKKIVLKEGGYDALPYHPARWATMCGEVYGRGPAMLCLPSIRLVNRQQFTIIKAGERAVLPPIVVENESVLLPIKRGPDAIIFKEPNSGPIETLRYEGNLPLTLEMVEMTRNDIRKSFYADWVKFNQKTERQTAYEISELVDQQLRMMGAVVGRIHDERLGPLLTRSVQLLAQHKQLPPMPQILVDAAKGTSLEYKINYISIAARAQKGSKAAAMGRFLQEIAPLAQVDPTVMDAIHTDNYTQELAILRGVPRKALRSPEEIAAIRQQRQQQQQLAAMTEAAEPLSKTVLNLSQAQESGNVVGL